MALEIAKDNNIGVFADGARMASFKFIQPGITEVTFIEYGDLWIGHISQLEKAEGQCLYFIETGNIPSSWYAIGLECRCLICRSAQNE